jgi:TPR repeat protein
MASQFLWKAVAKQNSEAVLLLSDLYARGDGVPRSCEQARILLIAGAKKGSSAAANKLRSIEQTCR